MRVWLGVVAVLYSLHRAALWAEDRGWIYYRTKRMPPGAGALAMMEVSSMLQPSVEHVIEETRTQLVLGEQAPSGADAP